MRGKPSDFSFADAGAHRRGGEEDFPSAGDAALLVAYQHLREDSLHHIRQSRAHLQVHWHGEGMQQMLQRGNRAQRGQRCKHEVAGLRGGQRGGDGLSIGETVNQNDVRVLAERLLQRNLVVRGISAHLPLVNFAFRRAMDEFDWILDGDNMGMTRAVDLLDHCGKRGRPSRTVRPGNQHQPMRLARELLDGGGIAQALQAGYLSGNDPEDRANRAALVKQVDSKARALRQRVGQV
ncbi:MAG: hypothetical protein BWY76_01660 [bacterium ADurb.Bin429]|nr:MAG: hypothetical protein BWY76_01660 [bacterium ADurb.Bin429]